MKGGVLRFVAGSAHENYLKIFSQARGLFRVSSLSDAQKLLKQKRGRCSFWRCDYVVAVVSTDACCQFSERGAFLKADGLARALALRSKTKCVTATGVKLCALSRAGKRRVFGDLVEDVPVSPY